MTSNLPWNTAVDNERWLSRVDVRAKLACLLLLTVATFVARDWWGLSCAALASLAALRSCGTSASTLFGALRPAAVVLAFSLLANGLVLDGGFDVQLVGPVGIRLSGLVRASLAVGRIVALVGFVLVVVATTTAPQISRAITGVLRPLGAWGVPVGDIAMAVSLALRLIPEAMEAFDQIVLAQRSRGVDFGGGSAAARLRKYASVMIPLVVVLFRRAEDLSRAMADRCYGSRGGVLRPLPFSPSAADFAAIVVSLLVLLAAIFL